MMTSLRHFHATCNGMGWSWLVFHCNHLLLRRFPLTLTLSFGLIYIVLYLKASAVYSANVSFPRTSLRIVTDCSMPKLYTSKPTAHETSSTCDRVDNTQQQQMQHFLSVLIENKKCQVKDTHACLCIQLHQSKSAKEQECYGSPFSNTETTY